MNAIAKEEQTSQDFGQLKNRLLDDGCGARQLALNAARVTWGACTELNASHAQDQAGVTKAATLELLRRNTPNPAAAVRAFTDEELDRAKLGLMELVGTRP